MTALLLTTGSVASQGEDIYWEMVSHGAGDDRPVVVLSHGAGGTHAVWYQQVPVLGDDFRVVTWDSRGFGNSTNRNDEPSPSGAAADLGAVLDHLDVGAAHLIGQSMGGWHISAFAESQPDRVRSLIYADTVGGLWTEALHHAFREFMQAGGLGAGPEVEVGLHPALWPGTANRDPAQAFLYQALGSFHDPPMHKIMTTIEWQIDHETINNLDVPVMFIAGEHDSLFPPALLADSCGQLVGSRYVEISDAGHSPYFEQPEAWNAAALDFLRGATPA